MEKVTDFPYGMATEGIHIPFAPIRFLPFSGQKFRSPTGKSHVKKTPVYANLHKKMESSGKQTIRFQFHFKFGKGGAVYANR
jgi:hypothetical protein